MFPPEGFPAPGKPTLITDQLAAPADFVLHNILGSHLKGKKDTSAVILSVSEPLARWKTVASRSNLDLTKKTTDGALTFIDVAKETAIAEPTQTYLHSLFGRIRLQIEESPSSKSLLLILDDVTTLEWIGFPTLVLARFLRSLIALCTKFGVTLLVRHHTPIPDEPDDLFRILVQLCHYQVEVMPLSSGRSGAVSGELALHACPSAVPFASVRPIPRTHALQYRLTDSGAVFFQRGTGQVVL
ncbi:hypothetical protein EVG20_g9141 [Dentipellis fragilis]|uniref:Elongator complex protein 5 n=1 Tax=Dentipellis fragilis TaxID=205917 RepID=A0A4Y9Y1W5_9AGAM|nr:hypothetical protein EVG20_g9141 [Dentipellis fragilis]